MAAKLSCAFWILTVLFKIEDFYRDIAKDVETRFDTNGYSKDENTTTNRKK